MVANYNFKIIMEYFKVIKIISIIKVHKFMDINIFTWMVTIKVMKIKLAKMAEAKIKEY